MTSSLIVLAASFVLTTALPVAAQTANSSPTAPAPGSMTGMPPASSTAAPSGARPDTGTPQVGAETETEKKEDQKANKDMTICKGC